MISEDLKKYVRPNGFIFLQEIHSSKNDIKKFEEEFRKSMLVYFACGELKSCGVLISFYGTKNVELVRKICDNLGRNLLVEI